MTEFDKVVLEQLAKNKSVEDIAKEQDVSVSDLEKELEKGTKAEHEHTASDKQAENIAKDHLVEDPKYYSKLKKAGL
jgi:hypothetical protein